jgi:membrane-associated phospholipid phosphatase
MRWLASLALLSAACASPAAALSDRGWDQASSIGRTALIVSALGLPAVKGDWKGEGQAALSTAGAYGLTAILKHAIPEQRPDHSNDRSFPSGHTSVSFAAAATLEKRYGWQVGIPAHVVAAFVGVARVQANKHFVHDVIAGAALGEATGWLLTSRHDGNVQWLPYADRHGAGATVAMRF